MILSRFARFHKRKGCSADEPPGIAALSVLLAVILFAACGPGVFAAGSSGFPWEQAVVKATGGRASEQASKLLEDGFGLLARNASRQAERAFRRAIEIQPELAAAHRGLGLALWAEGQSTVALSELTVATKLDPDDADAHLALGRLAWTLSRQSGLGGEAGTSRSAYQSTAITELAKAASLRPRDFQIRLDLADLHLEAGRMREAIEQATAAVGLAVSPREQAAAHVSLARTYFAQGEEKRAEAEFRAALDREPSSGEAHWGLGQLRLSQRRIPQAEDEFRKAIQVSPEYAPPYSALAEILIAKGQGGEARELLEKAVQTDPRDWQTKFQLATLLMEAGQAARATELLNEVTKLNPNFLPAREQLGLGLLRRGDLAAASKEAENLVAANPQAVEGHRLMALVLWKKRDLESSLAECAMVLASDPNSVAVRALQAIELWQLNRRKEARDTFAQAARAEPRLGTAVVFCRLLLCDARDIGVVDEFLRKNRWVVTAESPR